MSDVSPLPIVRSADGLSPVVEDWHRAGLRVGFVPTMGALHEGHLSLVRAARRHADRVVASIFVNPTQFAAHEDLGTYPRQEAADADLLAAETCDLLYAPAAQTMYQPDATTQILVGGPAQTLEGSFRPEMFGGVALVVCKLFNQVGPDVAVFGEKDWQQLMVIRRMVRDLDIPVEILGQPTARDAHGLALSSRNAYLSEDERGVARKLNVILAKAAEQVRAGAAVQLTERSAEDALRQAGFSAVDYVAVRDAESLGSYTPDRPGRVLAAARLGGTRLIDNLPI